MVEDGCDMKVGFLSIFIVILGFVDAVSGNWPVPSGGWDGSWVADAATQNFPMPTRYSEGAHPRYKWRQGCADSKNFYFYHSTCFIKDKVDGENASMELCSGGINGMKRVATICLNAEDCPEFNPDKDDIVYFQYRVGKISNQGNAIWAGCSYCYFPNSQKVMREIGIFWNANVGIKVTKLNGGYSEWYPKNLSEKFIDIRIVYNRGEDIVSIYIDGKNKPWKSGRFYWRTKRKKTSIVIGDGSPKIQGNVYLSNMYWASESLLSKPTFRDYHRWRIIQNNDDGSLQSMIRHAADYCDGNIFPMNKKNFLSRRAIGLEGTQVDAIFYCYSPPAGQIDFGYFTAEDMARLIKHDNKGTLAHDPQKAYEFWKRGFDIMIEFCRKNNIAIFWSSRMNDTHDSSPSEAYVFPKWKKLHPECLMGSRKDYGKFPYGGGRWSALDYGKKAVRDRVFEIFEYICNKYDDLDGIEMDFFRHPIFFRPQMTGKPVTQQHCDMMSSLVRRIRKMTEEVARKRKRPFLIAVRVPDSLGYAKSIGLDVVRWLEEGLVDMIIGGGYTHLEPWENLVELGKRYNVPVYACISYSRIKVKTCDWRNEAAVAWKAGVTGIYIFNYFNPRSYIWRELGSPETIKKEFINKNYEPIIVGQDRLGYWLKDAEKFVYKPKIVPGGCVFTGRVQITIIPPRKGQKVYYTLDGSIPTVLSTEYKGPIELNKNAIVKAKAFGPNNEISFTASENFVCVRKIISVQSLFLPFEIYGVPVGGNKTVDFQIKTLSGYSKSYLKLTMGDVDARKEVEIYINNNGPIFPPKEIVSDSDTKTGLIEVPLRYFKTGNNTIKFIFADNLNGTTRGFSVADIQILLN